MDEALELISVSLKSMKPVPMFGPDMRQCQSALILGASSIRELTFTFETCPLVYERAEQFVLLKEHGFAAVAAPSNWRYGYRSPLEWQGLVITKAIDRVLQRAANENGRPVAQPYNVELANGVLNLLNKFFPELVTVARLKYEFEVEPSNNQLMLALNALSTDGLIQSIELKPGIRSALHAFERIGLTAEGRKHLKNLQQPVSGHSVILNLGQIGAIGPNSTGAINTFYESWQRLERSTDLCLLAAELEKLRCEFRQYATTREDDAQLGVLSEAEYAAESGDGPGVMKALARIGKAVLETAERIGTDVAAKVIVEASKG